MKLGDLNIQWVGHACFLIEGSVRIYTDPYVLPLNPKKVDIILISHDHYDHCDEENIEKISKTETVVVAPKACASKLSGIKEISVGQSIELKGVKITAVPAYNIGKPFHPKGVGVGFVFRIDGKTFYHAGDTDFIPEMQKLRSTEIDIALLPIGGTYTMNEEEAVEAALSINPKIVIPMHYGKWRDISLKADPKKFKEMLEKKGIRVELL